MNIPSMYTPMTRTEAGNVTVEVQSDSVTESKFWILNESTTAVSNTINTMYRYLMGHLSYNCWLDRPWNRRGRIVRKNYATHPAGIQGNQGRLRAAPPRLPAVSHGNIVWLGEQEQNVCAINQSHMAGPELNSRAPRSVFVGCI